MVKNNENLRPFLPKRKRYSPPIHLISSLMSFSLSYTSIFDNFCGKFRKLNYHKFQFWSQKNFVKLILVNIDNFVNFCSHFFFTAFEYIKYSNRFPSIKFYAENETYLIHIHKFYVRKYKINNLNLKIERMFNNIWKTFQIRLKLFIIMNQVN
ncbi:hypothetical protein TRFO_33454 [Tritrichomonas foetus]|uniref:Uncharacterized protein n=1 Tax=Tritrichomonas foetus TaxID=1144522 RepID=A0A1J4JLK6_9EUKA|nr:hypothetical protein TRFO_33454 [Tritrichomonas foetus]|eukprot:OHS99992.1 hypothetical protein TRFO_33454 [Tritrichomonas foetus]